MGINIRQNRDEFLLMAFDKNLARNNAEDHYREETLDILKQIEEKSSQGHTEVYILNKEINTVIIELLVRKNFGIDKGDQTVRIYW